MTTSCTATRILSGDDGTGRRGMAAGTCAAGHPLPAEATGILMPDIDFSLVNLHYLLCARDLARGYPERAAVLLGVTPDLVRRIAELDPAALVVVAEVKAPLLVLRPEPWWWHRLFTALKSGRPEELRSVLEQAGLIVPHGGS